MCIKNSEYSRPTVIYPHCDRGIVQHLTIVVQLFYNSLQLILAHKIFQVQEAFVQCYEYNINSRFVDSFCR